MASGNGKDTSQEEILTGSIARTILHLAFPVFLAMSFQTFFNLVDTYFVSRLGADALAAMGLTFPFFMFTVALTQGMGIGASSLVARSVGAVDKERLQQVAGKSLFFALLTGLLFALLGSLLFPLLLQYMGAEESIAQQASSYLRIMFLFLPVKFLLFVFEGLFRGEGKTRLSMRVLMTATLCNILLDPLLIFGLGPFPAMGIAGASLATAISWFIGILMSIYFFYRSRTSLPLTFQGLGWGIDIYWQLIKIGFPASLSTGTMSISMIFLNRFAYDFSHQVVAAYAIGFRIDSLTILPGLAIAWSTIAMVGQNFGAREYLRARKTHLWAGGLVMLVMGFLALMIFLFPQALSAVFIWNGQEGEQVQQYGIQYLRFVAISYPFCGLGFVSNASFQGTGMGLPPLINALLRFFVLTLPISYLLAFILGLGPAGIWLGISAANIIFGLLSFVWVQRYLSRIYPVPVSD